MSIANDIYQVCADEKSIQGQIADQPMDNKPASNPGQSAAHSPDRSTDHNPDPLFKQYNKQNKTKQTQITTTTTPNAIRFYQENCGVTSSYVGEDIMGWIAEMGEPLVMDAMKRALEQNKTTWSYVKGILKAWEKKGIKTVEEAAADEMAFRNRGVDRRADSCGGEVIPDWFKEQKRKKKLAKQQRENSATAPDPAAEAKEREEIKQLLVKYGSNNGMAG